MTANQCDIGLIGLAVMGENLVLNMESKGFSVAVFNRTTEVTDKFAAGRAKGKNIFRSLCNIFPETEDMRVVSAIEG